MKNFPVQVSKNLPLTWNQLGQYAISSANTGSVEQTDAPVPPAPAEPSAEPSVTDQTEEGRDAHVTSHPVFNDGLIHQEEKVEYRDQDGNLLNEEEVAALKGKVLFETRYETRTRTVDAAGNEIIDGQEGDDGHTPPLPDVDGEPETAVDVPEDDGRKFPATVSPEDDIVKEHSLGQSDSKRPRPASEGIEATK